VTYCSEWAVIVPIRQLHAGKSRLEVTTRADFALAFLCDVMTALNRCSQVGPIVVVSPDPALERILDYPVVLDDASGLDEAVEAGRQFIAERGHIGPTAVILPDLPAIDPTELGAMLTLARHVDRGFVPDADGAGTTTATAVRNELLRTAFGEGSACRHRRLGYREIRLPMPTLRRDVDTLDDLGQAVTLGVGAHTASLLRKSAPLAAAK